MKKSLLILLGIMIVGTFRASAQCYEWAKIMGGGLGEGAYGMAIDGSGNIYITGFFAGTADFDPSAGKANLSAVGISDIFIAKYDANGNYIWARGMGGAANDYGRHIALDNIGNIYISGDFTSTVDFDPLAGITNLVSSGGSDMFVAKYDSGGRYVWAKRMGASKNDAVMSMALDANGDSYITGGFEGTIDFDPSLATAYFTATANSGAHNDVFIVKLDMAGNYVWAKTMGSTGLDDGWAIALDATGNVSVAGRFSGKVDFGGSGSLQSIGEQDIFLAKYSSIGTYEWAINIGNAGTSRADVRQNCLKVDKNGNAYLTGQISGTIDFDPSARTSNITSAGSEDAFLAKYDINGNYLWATRMGGTATELGTSLALDGAGNVYIMGIFNDSADFDPSQDTTKLVSVGMGDIFLAKYKEDGAYQWAIGFGGTQYDWGNYLVASNMNVWVTGICSPMVDFDPSPNKASPGISGQLDIFLAKYCGNAPVLSGSIKGAVAVCTNQDYTYTIDNDSASSTYIWTLPSGWTGISKTASIKVKAGSIGGKISVSARNSCGPSAPRNLNIAVTIKDVSVSETSGKLTANASGANYQWLDCSKSYASITGATYKTFLPDSNGYYAVAVTRNGCTDTSACYNSFPAEKHETNSVRLYPSPGDGHFIIEQIPAPGEMTVDVHNALGQKIFGQTYTIKGRLSMYMDVADGVYMVTLTYEGGDRVVRKLVVSR